MTSLIPGQRIRLGESSDFRVRLSGRDADRVAIIAIDPQGTIVAFDEAGPGQWHLPALSRLGDQFDIVAFITDDRNGGFVNSAYPLSGTIGADSYDFPMPGQQLAAVILGEVYTKDGTRRLKVSNEGFIFGIDAYVRARHLGPVTIPYRNRPSGRQGGPDGRRDRRESPDPGETIGSGSGVIVGPDLLVTNAHVIADGQGFQTGRTRSILNPVAVDPMHDLALLQGPVSGTPLPLRIDAPLWLGESIMASGYPLMDVLGADLKVTTGNVSGLTGSGGDISRFQFTAPIGSGSSGGAIIDEAGNLVGITAASLAHDNMRERGSISENVNFGVRAALVFELIAAAGMPLPAISSASGGANRRDVVNRLRNSVLSIIVTS